MIIERQKDMILYNVLNQEVVFEEYFCNLLQINDFRKLFIDFITEKNNLLYKENIQYKNFNTEVILNKNSKNYGRADLFLEVNNKEFIFEIKNKDWTDLTEKQPNEYLRYLNNRNEHLFFLIPKGYGHKDTILDRWKEYDNAENQIFYWQDLILKIKDKELKEIEIKMFYDFCIYWFDMKVVEFTNEEKKILDNKENKMKNLTGISIPRLVEKLEHIITNIGNNSDMKKDSEAISINYSKKIGDYIIYFGIDYDIWDKENKPLTLLIQNYRNNYQEFELEIKNENLIPIEYEETRISPKQFAYLVELKSDLGNDNFQETIKKQINHIFMILNKRT